MRCIGIWLRRREHRKRYIKEILCGPAGAGPFFMCVIGGLDIEQFPGIGYTIDYGD